MMSPLTGLGWFGDGGVGSETPALSSGIKDESGRGKAQPDMGTLLICLGLMAWLVWTLIQPPLVRRFNRSSHSNAQASLVSAEKSDIASGTVDGFGQQEDDRDSQRILDCEWTGSMQIDTNKLRWDD